MYTSRAHTGQQGQVGFNSSTREVRTSAKTLSASRTFTALPHRIPVSSYLHSLCLSVSQHSWSGSWPASRLRSLTRVFNSWSATPNHPSLPFEPTLVRHPSFIIAMVRRTVTWYKQLTPVRQAKIMTEVCAADRRRQDRIAAGQRTSSSKPGSVEEDNALQPNNLQELRLRGRLTEGTLLMDMQVAVRRVSHTCGRVHTYARSRCIYFARGF